jgi:tRNA threonylcarbamoyl adenosine modification protein YeaZ
MLVLALDTATPALTVGLADVSTRIESLAGSVQVDPRRHGELLAPAITAVLAGSGNKPTDLAAVVAGLGPGPFTGLRVGLATAQALADALAIPVYGVCSLDAIDVPAEPTLVATDARRKELYWATYRAGMRDSGPAVDRPAELAERLPELGVTAMAGAGADLYRDMLPLPLTDARYPTAENLIARAAERILGKSRTEILTPLYLRRPDVTIAAARKPVSQL